MDLHGLSFDFLKKLFVHYHMPAIQSLGDQHRLCT